MSKFLAREQGDNKVDGGRWLFLFVRCVGCVRICVFSVYLLLCSFVRSRDFEKPFSFPVFDIFFFCRTSNRAEFFSVVLPAQALRQRCPNGVVGPLPRGRGHHVAITASLHTLGLGGGV